MTFARLPSNLATTEGRTGGDACRRPCCWSERARAASCWRATPTAATGTSAGRSARAGPSTTRCTTRLGRDLRGRRERVARRGRLAQHRSRRDVGALERGPGLRRRQRAEALEGLGPDGGARARCSPAPRRPACSRAATAARPGRCSARSTASPAATTGTIPPTSRPAISACPAILPHPDEPSRFWVVVQGFGIFETTDDGATWTPRNRGLRADWPLEDPEVGYCVHKLVMSPVDTDRLYQQNHVGMHRSDDAGQSWDGDHRGAADRVRLRRRRASRTTATAST